MNRACVLLARAPSAPGKTRLTANLAAGPAVALRRALLLDTYETVCATGLDLFVAFAPNDGRVEMEMLLDRSGTMFIAQRGSDLGERMHNAFVDAFARGAQQTVLVGSDLPSLPSSHLTEAFDTLDRHDIVLGPAEDGGYYLVGLNGHAVTSATALFEQIAWGSDAALSQTLAAASTAGLRTALIASWFDVDTRDDLARISSDPRLGAAHTRDWLAKYPTTD